MFERYGNKNLFFNPALLTTSQRNMIVRKSVDRESHFVILASIMYWGGCQSGYNVAKAPNLADPSGPEDRSVVSTNREVERPLHQCIVPFERILWKEACNFVWFFFVPHTSKSTPCVRQFWWSQVHISQFHYLQTREKGFPLHSERQKTCWGYWRAMSCQWGICSIWNANYSRIVLTPFAWTATILSQ